MADGVQQGAAGEHRRRWLRHGWFVIAALLAAVVAVLVLSPTTSLKSSRGPRAGVPGAVRVDARVTLAGGAAVKVPRSFLGISAEYWTVPIWGRETKILQRVFAQLSPDGTVRLRIGGDSADRAQWSPTKELPEWVFELTPEWLRRTSRIVRATGAHLILDLNTMSSTPKLAALWAKTAIAGLPRGSIRAFEVGNEPDIYNQAAWQHMTTGPGAPPLPKRITAASYARSFAAYAKAVSGVAHGIPLLAPALAEPQKNADWLVRLLAAPHPRLAGVTAHRYPYSACARPTAPTYPSIARVLSEPATAGMGSTARLLERITDRAKLPIWLTEINSVTCGGISGVSNTFATALWAPDALFELIRAGTEAAFVHIRPPLTNMAFSLTRSGLAPRPLLYGLILFARTLGPGAQLLPLRVAASPSRHIKAWAVRDDRRVIHVLLLDKGARPARFSVRLPNVSAASLERLTAPGVAATTGMTLAHQRLTRYGTWTGSKRTERVSRSASGFIVRVGAYSAALMTLHLR